MNVVIGKLSLRSPSVSLKSFFASQTAFCTGIAFLMVVLRLVCFDFDSFFRTEYVPNHDMYQGASLFATSMHSIRLSGELAWWNPLSNNGYAQYYQSFFSPLAPTPHHIVFIVWAQLIRVLSLLGIVVPEYLQYLFVNYLILPFLTFLAFSVFATLIFRSRTAVFLVLTVYTFSGIGLWNSAWFYFQESFSLFFLLAAAIGVLKKPNVARFILLLAAYLVQATSFNYWTMYNSWFIIILLGSYCITHPNQLRRLGVRIMEAIKQHTAGVTIAATLFVLVVGLWFVIIGSIVVEQSGNYMRVGADVGTGGTFSLLEAYGRVQKLRTFTIELFNPNIQRALQSYPIIVPVHNARYIGAFLLPLLALLPLYQWHRRERWLLISAIGVLAVCFAPPFLLSAWQKTPFMDRIRHFFYFYTHFWQLMLVLLAGASMDRLIRQNYSAVVKRRFLIIISGLITLMVLMLLGLGSLSHRFPAGDENLEANLHFAIVTLITSITVFQMLLFPTAKNKRLFVSIFLVIAVVDMTRYFWNVSIVDRQFTDTRWGAPGPLPLNIQAALQRPWSAPDTSQGFKGGLFDNMPVRNLFWPDNIWMGHRYFSQLKATPDIFEQNELEGPPLSFFTTAELALQPSQVQERFKDNPGPILHNEVLLLQSNAYPDLLRPQVARERMNDLRFDVTNPNLWQVSGMKPIPDENPAAATWVISRSPLLRFNRPLSERLLNYTHFYVRMAASPDISPRTLKVYFLTNGQKTFTEKQSVTVSLAVDSGQHTYAFDLKRLGLPRQSRLTGLRLAPAAEGSPIGKIHMIPLWMRQYALDPVAKGALTGKNLVQIADVRLIGGAGQVTQTAKLDNVWNEWRYNTFDFEVNTPRNGWLLIRQLYDPLWHITIDGRPVQPVQANFVGMALPINGGQHQIRMDYRPLARGIYWSACLLLEITLLAFVIIALRIRSTMSLRRRALHRGLT
jgi:hypothetical protein